MKSFCKIWIVLLFLSLLISCVYKPNRKYLSFENLGNSEAKITIIDNKNNQYMDNIEPDWTKSWYDDEIGDFKCIYIKYENSLEGIFIISNKYNKKIFPYDIYSINGYRKKVQDDYEKYEKIIFSDYEIIIRIVEDLFEIEYNDIKFTVSEHYNYDDNFLYYKEKYMKEYNFNE